MNLTLNNRDQLAQLPALLNELDQLVARINLVYGREHDPQTGRHAAITVDSLGFNAGGSQFTVGAAGSASPLPATPSAYQTVSLNGVEYVSPLYQKS